MSKFNGKVIKNYHAHTTFNNLYQETNKTIFRELSKSDLMKIQDILSAELRIQIGKRCDNEKYQHKKRKGSTNCYETF